MIKQFLDRGKVKSAFSVLKRLAPLLFLLSVSLLPLCSHEQSIWSPFLGTAAPSVSRSWTPCSVAIRGLEVALISPVFTLALLGRSWYRVLLRPALSPLGSLAGCLPLSDKLARPCLIIGRWAGSASPCTLSRCPSRSAGLFAQASECLAFTLSGHPPEPLSVSWWAPGPPLKAPDLVLQGPSHGSLVMACGLHDSLGTNLPPALICVKEPMMMIQPESLGLPPFAVIVLQDSLHDLPCVMHRGTHSLCSLKGCLPPICWHGVQLKLGVCLAERLQLPDELLTEPHAVLPGPPYCPVQDLGSLACQVSHASSMLCCL
jgi:hypothetical protein